MRPARPARSLRGDGYKPSRDGSLVYLYVDKIDPTLEALNSAGGETLMPWTSIGEHGFIAHFRIPKAIASRCWRRRNGIPAAFVGPVKTLGCEYNPEVRRVGDPVPSSGYKHETNERGRKRVTAETASTAPPVDKPKRWPKHAVWMGVAITSVGFLSYYSYFAQFPVLRDLPVVNLPFVFLGVIVTAAGCWQIFKQRGGVLGKSLSGLGLVLTLVITGFFNFYIFSMSYQLPESSEAMTTDATALDFTLLDHNSRSVSLADSRGQKVVLVFYRGFW